VGFSKKRAFKLLKVGSSLMTRVSRLFRRPVVERFKKIANMD